MRWLKDERPSLVAAQHAASPMLWGYRGRIAYMLRGFVAGREARAWSPPRSTPPITSNVAKAAKVHAAASTLFHTLKVPADL